MSLPGFVEGEMLERTDKTKLVEKQKKELIFWERRYACVTLHHGGQASLLCWTVDVKHLQLLQKDFNFHNQVKYPG